MLLAGTTPCGIQNVSDYDNLLLSKSIVVIDGEEPSMDLISIPGLDHFTAIETMFPDFDVALMLSSIDVLEDTGSSCAKPFDMLVQPLLPV